MPKQKIRIKLKSFDHRFLDHSAVQVVDAADRPGPGVMGSVNRPKHTQKC